ncbi:MAG: hypothetical protein WAQ99_09040 [Pyrinomonadaceae bacterium]
MKYCDQRIDEAFSSNLECGGKYRGPQRVSRAGVVVARRRFGLPSRILQGSDPKRRRRFALPAHSKGSALPRSNR